jgi:DNA-binding XRE family transcriptional regulator
MAKQMTTQHMTGAELQTLREACNLGRDEFAELVRVEARTVKHWENGRAGVPADVAAVVERLDQSISQAVSAGLVALRDLRARAKPGSAEGTGGGSALGDMVLIRYRTAHDLAKYQPDMRGLPLGAHGAIVQRFRQSLRYLPGFDGVPVRVVWMDTPAYEAWRAACRMDNTPATLSAWADEQIAIQAIPHRGDQPPKG